MASGPAILWFREDLRLADNPALLAACAGGRPVLAVHIEDDASDGPAGLGRRARWWRDRSLDRLARDLAGHGVRLHRRVGASFAVLRQLGRLSGAGIVCWNRRYQPWATAQERAVETELLRAGIEVASCNARLVHEPWEISQANGLPYRVFTPFMRRWSSLPGLRPHPRPGAITDCGVQAPDDGVAASLDEHELAGSWQPGEAGAIEAASRFLDQAIEAYDRGHNMPAMDGTSRLSPHLRHGEIGPSQILAAIDHRVAAGDLAQQRCWPFVRQLVWREFAHYSLFHCPTMTNHPVRAEFERFPWLPDERLFAAWTRGSTGYPFVDAGMRQLEAEGWMHTRLRLITGSFLTKHLLQPWQDGAAWFAERLVDADPADNSFGWQWVTGCGFDAAPYFRIFNPVVQGLKFDPAGTYVRRWLPELARMPPAWIMRPFAAPASVLDEAGVELDVTYPRPIVDHARARDRAMQAWRSIRGETGRAPSPADQVELPV